VNIYILSLSQIMCSKCGWRTGHYAIIRT